MFKVFPKSVKLSPGPASLTRQDTIEEGGEGESSCPPSRETSHRASIQLEGRPQLAIDRPTKTERDPLLDTLEKERAKERMREERNLSLERDRQIEMAKARETTSDNYDTGLREQPSTLAQRDLISTVLDMKVDVRLEMQRMSQRISRIEDLLTDLVSRLVVDSSEQSSPGDNNASQASATSPTGTPTINVPSSSGSLTPSGPNTGGGNGLGPILLRKRRSKVRKPPAPAPPPKQYSESEETRLIESDIPSTSSRKREFL
jgi:potassium voltage-gated channel Eag-related subfamily H member 5